MLHEFVQVVFKPRDNKREKEAKEIERIESANRLERLAAKAYLEGQITIKDCQLMNELTFPITKIDFRKLADERRKNHQP